MTDIKLPYIIGINGMFQSLVNTTAPNTLPQPLFEGGAPIAQLGEHWTLDRKVAGSILNRGVVLCLEQDTSSPLLSTGKTQEVIPK